MRAARVGARGGEAVLSRDTCPDPGAVSPVDEPGTPRVSLVEGFGGLGRETGLCQSGAKPDTNRFVRHPASGRGEWGSSRRALPSVGVRGDVDPLADVRPRGFFYSLVTLPRCWGGASGASAPRRRRTREVEPQQGGYAGRAQGQARIFFPGSWRSVTDTVTAAAWSFVSGRGLRGAERNIRVATGERVGSWLKAWGHRLFAWSRRGYARGIAAAFALQRSVAGRVPVQEISW